MVSASEPTFGPAGTVYLLVDETGAGQESQRSLVALDAGGHLKPGWPVTQRPGSTFGSIAVGPDGSVYVEECGALDDNCVLHRLGTDGRELPGWPFDVPPSATCSPSTPCGLVVGSDGTAYLTSGYQIGEQTQIVAIDASGTIELGWPAALGHQNWSWSNPQLGSDGTVFILSRFAGSEDSLSLSLSALAPDGRPRPGWPVTVPDMVGYLLGPQGTVVVRSLIDDIGELCSNPRRTVFTVLGPDGRTLPGWPRGSKGFASSPVIGADGTVYYVSALDKVYAHDRAGEIKAGWPVPVPGANNGCGGTGPYLAPDGTTYVLADDSVAGSEVASLSPDGSSRPGWPYRPAGQLSLPCLDMDCVRRPAAPAFGPDGTVYVVVYRPDPAGSWLEVVALDRQGQLRPGWPYRLPIDPASVEVDSLTVSPDGRLFVRSGYNSEYVLLALDSEGRISE